MADTLSSDQRHRNMAAIHSSNTKPEVKLRHALWKWGFRYKVNDRSLPGSPDIVLPKYRSVIFVHGCFWHGHKVQVESRASAMGDRNEELHDSACCRIPTTNREFWVRKIRRNMRRDVVIQQRLAQMGWHCMTVWECELRPSVREQTLRSLAFTLNRIWLQDHSLRRPYPQRQEEELVQIAAEERFERL